MQDNAHILQEQVLEAAREKQPLVICGGGSKSFYGRAISGKRLETGMHAGIIDYAPTELTLTARAGTSLAEINAALRDRGQVLACEPPLFSTATTFGGVVAAGLSGPSRPFRASIQDTVLGCRLLNGRGEILRFGGKVMKNVAGYDLSRLMTGSLGCLGVILDVTVKVIPATMDELTVVFAMDRVNSTSFVNDLRRQGLPVSATCQQATELLVRFSAGSREIAGIPGLLEAHYSFINWREQAGADYWAALRDHALPFFETDKPLWRLSAAPGADMTPLLAGSDGLLTEWGGALHWLKSDLPAAEVFAHLAAVEGHATLFRPGTGTTADCVFQPLQPVLLEWHRRLKLAFDPAGIFNAGRMYAEF